MKKYKETRQTGSDMVKLNNIILKKAEKYHLYIWKRRWIEYRPR